jgi:MFS family permease
MPVIRKDKNILILGLTSLFNDFSNEMILAVFPAFFASVLKSGAASLGLVEGIADGMSNLLKIYSGGFSDKLQNRKVFIVLGYTVAVIIRPFYAVASTVGSVLGLRVVDRIGKGVREPPRDVLISASTKNDKMGQAFGFHRAMDALGGILGPLAAYLILRKYPGGYNIIFMYAFVLGLIAVATIFFVRDIQAKNEDGSRKISVIAIRSFPKRFKVYLLAVIFLSIGSLPVAILLLKTVSIGLMIASIPLFYMIYNTSFSVFSLVAGRLSDHLGAMRIIVFGFLILLISYFAIFVSSTAVALGIAFALAGIFSACTDAGQRSLIGRIIPLEHRGSAYGFFNAFNGFGAMVAGIAGGYMWQHVGSDVTLLVAGFFVIAGVLVLVIDFGIGKWKARQLQKIVHI